MKITTVLDVVSKFFAEELKRPGEVIGIEKTENGWKAYIEVVEEDEYMRVRAKDDLVATYEVLLDDSLDILGFQRITVRERDELPAERR